MREHISRLEEAITGAPRPFVAGEAPDEAPDDTQGDEESLEEGVTQQLVTRIIDAMVEAPKVQTLLAKAGGEEAGSLGELMKGHLRHSVPLALMDAGITVQSALAGKAKRGIKMIAKGKGMGEVIDAWNEPISEDDEELEQTLRGILDEE